MERKGDLLIDFHADDEDSIVCTVKDNGVGRKRAAELRTKKHKSRGMEIVNERVQTINFASDMEVYVDIMDMVEDDIAMGTEVKIGVKYID